MNSTQTARPTKTDYVEMLVAQGRPEVLKMTRRLGVSAGSIKDTREIAGLLYDILAANLWSRA